MSTTNNFSIPELQNITNSWVQHGNRDGYTVYDKITDIPELQNVNNSGNRDGYTADDKKVCINTVEDIQSVRNTNLQN